MSAEKSIVFFFKKKILSCLWLMRDGTEEKENGIMPRSDRYACFKIEINNCVGGKQEEEDEETALLYTAFPSTKEAIKNLIGNY